MRIFLEDVHDSDSQDDAWDDEVLTVRYYFRVSMSLELFSILFIFAATLITSWGRMHANCPHLAHLGNKTLDQVSNGKDFPGPF